MRINRSKLFYEIETEQSIRRDIYIIEIIVTIALQNNFDFCSEFQDTFYKIN